MRKVAFASFIGTAVEFYDFYIYGTAATLERVMDLCEFRIPMGILPLIRSSAVPRFPHS